LAIRECPLCAAIRAKSAFDPKADDAKVGWSYYAGRKVTGKVVISH
jgi:hypothetical protein